MPSVGMLNAAMLRVANMPFMLIVFELNVVIVNVILNVVAPSVHL